MKLQNVRTGSCQLNNGGEKENNDGSSSNSDDEEQEDIKDTLATYEEANKIIDNEEKLIEEIKDDVLALSRHTYKAKV